MFICTHNFDNLYNLFSFHFEFACVCKFFFRPEHPNWNINAYHLIVILSIYFSMNLLGFFLPVTLYYSRTTRNCTANGNLYVEETDQLIRLDSNMNSTLGTFTVNHPDEGTVNKINFKKWQILNSFIFIVFFSTKINFFNIFSTYVG